MTELQSFLVSFNLNKFGKKQELQHRVLEFVHQQYNVRNERVLKKIEELYGLRCQNGNPPDLRDHPNDYLDTRYNTRQTRSIGTRSSQVSHFGNTNII